MSDLWTTWATGVLQGIGAPVNGVNLDTLWAWSGAESGADRMRWNNPLNTTQPEGAGTVDMNKVGVKAYPSVQIGINATVTTLRNGYYPTIVNYLRGSVPRSSWSLACRELGIWGTGCAWLTANYGAAPQEAGQGEDDLTPDQASKLNEIWQVIQNGGLSTPSTSPDNSANNWWLVQAMNNIAGSVQKLAAAVEDIKGRVELIEQSPAIGAEHTSPPGP